jgi:hypothetical protein
MVGPANAEDRVITLPEIVIGGEAPMTPARRCVDVQIGDSRAYDCLNQRLKQQVDRINPSANIPPVDARSPDLRLGIVNMPAVQQQYGRNFGVSVRPYRPPALYTAPIRPR